MTVIITNVIKLFNQTQKICVIVLLAISRPMFGKIGWQTIDGCCHTDSTDVSLRRNKCCEENEARVKAYS